MKDNIKALSSVTTAHVSEKYLDKDEKSILPHYDEIKF
jgi:hypothetical protein